MRRILVEWRGLRLYSYPVMLYFGLLVSVLSSGLFAALANLDPARMLVAALLLTVPMLAGARLLFLLIRWRRYRQVLGSAWQRAEGGSALDGALPLTLPLSIPLLAALGLPFWPSWDVLTPAILLGLCVGRVGCLLHGCCAGRPTASRFGLVLPDAHGVVLHRVPTQLLEIGWTAALLVLTLALWPWRPFPGSIFLGMLAVFVAGRIAIVPLRAPDHAPTTPIRQRALATALLGCSLTMIALFWARPGFVP